MQKKQKRKFSRFYYDAEFDVLIIETTGAAHPVEALDAVYSPLFAEKLNIKGIVTVADSKLWLNRETLITTSTFIIYGTNPPCSFIVGE